MSFKDIFQTDFSVVNNAHARVNLIGEHTDYTGGYVLPALLNFKTTIQISKNNKNQYQVYSENYNEKNIFNDFIKSKNNEWIDYVKGCLFIFYDENKHIPNTHLNIFISSNIPMGRGISSSSALCVAILKTLNKYFKSAFLVTLLVGVPTQIKTMFEFLIDKDISNENFNLPCSEFLLTSSSSPGS